VLSVTSFAKNDPTTPSYFLCEKITDYTCPAGSFLFDGLCYTLFTNLVTQAQADRNCYLMGGQLLAVLSRKQMTFINAAFPSYDYGYNVIWLDYRKITYNLTDTVFRAIDDRNIVFSNSTGLDFTSTAPVLTDPNVNCVVMDASEGDFNGWRSISCFQNASYICQQSQLLAPSLRRIIPVLQLLLPLDLYSGFRDLVLMSRPNSGNLVAISADKYLPSQLAGAAHFLGKSNSYLHIDNGAPAKSINSQFGISVSMWIYIDVIYDFERQFLIDARPECNTGLETDEGFVLYLWNRQIEAFMLNYSIPLPCNMSTPFIVTTATTQNVHLAAKLCSYNTTTKCQVFFSPETYLVPVKKWTHVGFTYSAVSQRGTFFIDNNYGYYNGSTQSDSLSSYFSFDSLNWLTNSTSVAVSAPIRVGSRKYQQSGSFAGKMSCLQWYEGPLTQSQFLHLSKCPVNSTYSGIVSLCPIGFHYYKKNCYKFSPQPQDFSTAEAYCTSTPGCK
jgi:hypothetical protein